MNSSEKRHRNKYFKLMLSGALTLIFLPLLMMIFSIQVGPRVHRTTLSSTFEPLTADNWFTFELEVDNDFIYLVYVSSDDSNIILSEYELR